MQTYSVQEINAYIQQLFDTDATLRDVWVQGEVSNLNKHGSGHWYFSVKDKDSQLRCVMFKNANQYVRVDVKNGAEILVHGRISTYPVRGEYQLYADQIEAIGGVGGLYQQFEALKAQLDDEGLFDRKRPLPEFPAKIGVVTSPTTAAFQDMQNVLRRRFPLVEVILSPTLVQGNDAPLQIVQAIQRLNEFTDVDVIIIARGGGSIEDLWCFNDERVARAIYASDIPVISGIGHEIDFTIADFVADLRAPTPSAAAEVATPNKDDLLLNVDRQATQLNILLTTILNDTYNLLDYQRQRLNYGNPQKTITAEHKAINDFDIRMKRATQQRLQREHERLKARMDALESANPTSILARGYAIVTDEDGQIIKSATQVSTDDRLNIQLHDHSIHVRVED